MLRLDLFRKFRGNDEGRLTGSRYVTDRPMIVSDRWGSRTVRPPDR